VRHALVLGQLAGRPHVQTGLQVPVPHAGAQQLAACFAHCGSAAFRKIRSPAAGVACWQ
jgi:hypothetical protein